MTIDEDVLRAAIEQAPVTIFVVAAGGAVRFVTPPPPGIGAQLADQVAATVREVIATGVGASAEVSHHDASTVWYRCHISPVRAGDAITGAIVVARDITSERLDTERFMVADRLAAAGTLAAGVAHEINNPLAAVVANVDLALRDLGELPGAPAAVVDRIREELREASAAAARVSEIVRELQLFSRGDADQRGLVDVPRTLETTLRIAGNEIKHRARLVRALAPVPAVDANEARLGQVFLNLILNAAQAIPEGDVDRHQITVTTRPEGELVVVEIADTGAGIPEEIRGKVFTPFFTTRPVGVGTGLGLSISHRIVSGLGGTITFTSEPGRGTTFRVTLPAARRAERPARPSRPVPTAPTARARILVVDDEPMIIRTVRRILGADHDVVDACDGAAALALIAGGARFDVILCDLMMPRMTGMELHGELSRIAPDQADRIVFMTGGAFTDRAREFLASSANARVDKPFDAAGLRSVVTSLLG